MENNKTKQLKKLREEMKEVKKIHNLCVFSNLFCCLSMLSSLQQGFDEPSQIIERTMTFAGSMIICCSMHKLGTKQEKLKKEYDALIESNEKKLVK